MHFDLLELGEAALRLGVALLLGSAIGFERQWNQKMAGLRTNALVALGAAGFVTFSGLVGAGVILREGVNVHGLNTAATLWCLAMVGTMAGAGHGGPALLAAGMVIATNLVLRPLIRRLNSRLVTSSNAETHYTVEVVCRGAEEAQMRSLLLNAFAQSGLGLRRLDSEDIADTSKVTVTAQAVAAKRNDAALEQIVGRLSLDPTVTGVTWQIDRTILES